MAMTEVAKERSEEVGVVEELQRHDDLYTRVVACSLAGGNYVLQRTVGDAAGVPVFDGRGCFQTVPDASGTV